MAFHRRTDWYRLGAFAALGVQLVIGSLVVHAQAQRLPTPIQAVINQAHDDQIAMLAATVRRLDETVTARAAQLDKLNLAVGAIEETRKLEYGIIVAVTGQLILSGAQVFWNPKRRRRQVDANDEDAEY